MTGRSRSTLGRRAVTGYVPGVFDLFHIGHLNILRRARIHCDHLIAGVVSDEVALAQKGRRPVVGERERLEIVAAMRVVDAVHLETTTDKLTTWTEVGFDVVFKGDDWKGTPKWTHLEREFASRGVRVVYLPYTPVTSSTERRELTR
ncbi:glycerol-3-phosphate cytidylyltransferase [Kineococcus radiotolerans]|uniref:Cytidyltransferase-related domain n=2 Tax=Kineococcus radiotolerans TaxID=131568 RepID=A6W921_KINRD|nr:adenylyltransferase/cytidyltransferase family protein [Kineococcus radiotolerans]ABS03310.1 cytidyltransferase-related domain [Kineococcus radiotolerans SRS30216 = ATCC BAA-149]MBB2899571.1 glycerol-3-phosphate cytidylyltransferase [Kineococcus radiotolerans]